jgi:hypothetical protein
LFTLSMRYNCLHCPISGGMNAQAWYSTSYSCVMCNCLRMALSNVTNAVSMILYFYRTMICHNFCFFAIKFTN